MTNDEGLKPEGAPERSSKAGGGVALSGGNNNGPKRFSVQRKMVIVARLLRGEPLDLVGPANECLHRQANRVARSRACRRGYELLYAKIAAMEGKRPLAYRRSRR